jgi:hypothetical protein
VEQNRALCLVILRDAGTAVQQIADTYETFQSLMESVLAPILGEERKRGYFVGMSDRDVLELAMSLLLGLSYKWLLVGGKEGQLLAEGSVAVNAMLKALHTSAYTPRISTP